MFSHASGGVVLDPYKSLTLLFLNRMKNYSAQVTVKYNTTWIDSGSKLLRLPEATPSICQ